MLVVLLIALFLVALYMGLMQYYAWGWVLTPIFETSPTHRPSTKITIIVPARNEAPHLGHLLQCLLAQDYPVALTEIVVVDDHSDDATVAIAQGMGVKVLSLPAHLTGKKAAIAFGVAQSTGQLIITTDADCAMGAHWAATLVLYYEAHGHKVITGPVAFAKPQSGGANLLYHFQSLDLMGLMFITAGSLRFRFPHMANGANFAFEKKLFEAIGGYSGIDHTPTGDDILFLLKAHSHHPGCAGFVKAKEAIVATHAAPTWAAFWQQRLRWVSKSAGFGDARLTAILIFYYLYTLGIVGAGVAIFVWPFMFLPFALLLLGKWLPEVVMMAHATFFFGRAKELFWFIPSQLVHIYYVLRIGIESQMKKYEWKGREYGKPRKI